MTVHAGVSNYFAQSQQATLFLCCAAIRNYTECSSLLFILSCLQTSAQALLHTFHLADFEGFLPTFPRHAYAIALCPTCLSVGSLEKRSLSSQTPTEQQHNLKHLSKRGRATETERETLCHCRVRDYKLNCTLPCDMSAQQLPASNIRGEEGIKKEGKAREAVHASSAINLSVFVCSKQKRTQPVSLTCSQDVNSEKTMEIVNIHYPVVLYLHRDASLFT